MSKMMKTVVTAADDGVAKVWVFNEGEVTLVGKLQGESKNTYHNGAITSLHCFSNTEGLVKVLTTSNDCTAKVWGRDETGEWSMKQTLPAVQEAASGELTEEERLKNPFQRLIDRKKEKIAAAEAKPKEAQKEPQQERRDAEDLFAGHGRPVLCGLWMPALGHTRGPDGNPQAHKVVTAAEDGSIIIWNSETGKRHLTLAGDHGHSGPVRMFSWSRNKRELKLMTASDDGSMILWDARSGAQQKVFQDQAKTKECPIWCAHFSINEPDVQILSVSQRGCRDGRVQIWDTNTGQLSKIGTKDKLYYTDPTPGVKDRWDGHDPSGGVFLWDSVVWADWMNADVQHLQSDPNFGFLTSAKTFLVWNFDGQLALVDHSKDGACKVFGTIHDGGRKQAHGACIWTAQSGKTGATSHMVLTSSHDATAAIWDIRKENIPIYLLVGHKGMLWNASFSPDDHWVVTCSEDKTAQAFRVDGHRIVLGGSKDSSSTQHLGGKVLTDSPDDLNPVTHTLAVTSVDWELRADPWAAVAT